MHWLYVQWFDYWWPSIKGNGPEAVVQTVAYAVIAYIFIPPFREWFQKDLHAKIDHFIKHSPDIPPFVPKEKK